MRTSWLLTCTQFSAYLREQKISSCSISQALTFLSSSYTLADAVECPTIHSHKLFNNFSSSYIVIQVLSCSSSSFLFFQLRLHGKRIRGKKRKSWALSELLLNLLLRSDLWRKTFFEGNGKCRRDSPYFSSVILNRVQKLFFESDASEKNTCECAAERMFSPFHTFLELKSSFITISTAILFKRWRNSTLTWHTLK